MEITWYGVGQLKFASKDLTIVTDPHTGKLTADVVTVSHKHDRHSNTAAVAGSAFVIDGPGEYEVKGAVIEGVPSFHDNDNGKSHGRNTIYTIVLEDIKICHLGDLGHKLTDQELEAIGDVDILIVPIGGKTTIDAEVAAAVVSEIEPKVVIPVHYEENPATLTTFIKEVGQSEQKNEPKLKLFKKDLPQEEMHLVVLGQEQL